MYLANISVSAWSTCRIHSLGSFACGVFRMRFFIHFNF